jgi:hypothetical protein
MRINTDGLKVVRVSAYGSNPWAIVTQDGTPVEVPRVIVRKGNEPTLRFFGAFFARKREAQLALDLLRIEQKMGGA